MGLSQNMIQWVTERVREAQAILVNPRSTESQRTLAKWTLSTWEVR